MSMHMDGASDGDSSSYASFEFDHITVDHEATGDNGNAVIRTQFEPMRERGGLENDELAEIVAVMGYARCSGDNGEGIDVTSNGTAEYRGTFGINLSDNEALEAGQGLATTSFSEVTQVSEGPSIGDTKVETKDDPGILGHFDVDASASSNGPTDSGHQDISRNFREVYGRGPVIDATDELSFIDKLILNGYELNLEANHRLTYVYDVMTVEGARKRFDLPR